MPFLSRLLTICALQVTQEAGEADAQEERLNKRRRISDRGEAAARTKQDESPSLMPTQPMSSWEAGAVPGTLVAPGPPRDAVKALVAKAASLAAAISPSSEFLTPALHTASLSVRTQGM